MEKKENIEVVEYNHEPASVPDTIIIPTVTEEKKSPLDRARGQIKLAYIMAYIQSGLSMVPLFFNSPDPEIIVRSLVSMLFCGGLAFGVMKKSRVCASILFILACRYIIVYAIWGFENGINVDIVDVKFIAMSIGAIITHVFFYAIPYVYGIVGTFKYHKLIKNVKDNTME